MNLKDDLIDLMLKQRWWTSAKISNDFKHNLSLEEIENVLEKLINEGIIQKAIESKYNKILYRITNAYRETKSKSISNADKKIGIYEMKHLKPFGQVGGTHYWGNAAAGILPICTTSNKLLLGYRGLECNEPHTWGIFGGKVDDDSETVEEVALRELYEETGYKGEIELIPAYIYKDKKHNFEYHSFVGLVPFEFEPRLNWENEKTKWFTYEEALNLSYDLHFGVAKWLKDLKNYYPSI